MSKNDKEKGRNDHIIEGSIMLGIGVVFMLILVGAFGKAGDAVTNFFVGVFGYASYAYFLALIIFGILDICKVKRPKIKILRLLSLVMFFALVIALLHCVSSSQLTEGGYGKYLSEVYDKHSTAGGVLAGIFLYPLLLVDYLGIVICSLLAIGFGGVFVFYDNIIARFANRGESREPATMVNFGGANGISEVEIINNDMMVEDVQKGKKARDNTSNEYVTLDEASTTKVDFGMFDNNYSIENRESVQVEEKKSSFDTAYEILYGLDKQEDSEPTTEKPIVDIGDKSDYLSYTNDYRKKQIIDGLSDDKTFGNDSNKSVFEENIFTKRENNDIFSNKSFENKIEDKAEIARVESVPESVEKQEEKEKLSKYEEFIRKNNQGVREQKVEPTIPQKPMQAKEEKTEVRFEYTKDREFEPKEDKFNANVYEEKAEVKPIFDTTSKYDDMPVEDKTATHKEIEGFEHLLKHQKEERQRKESEIVEKRHNLTADYEVEEDFETQQERKRKERSDKGGVHNTSKVEAVETEQDVQQTPITQVTPTKPVEQVFRPAPQIKAEPRPLEVAVEKVTEEVKREKTKIKLAPYKYPPVSLLKDYECKPAGSENFDDKIEILETTLSEFGIDAKVNNVVTGPTFSRLELVMPKGIPVKRVLSYVDDIAMCLEVKSVRCQIPIPGKNAFGVEIPNNVRGKVGLKSVIESDIFTNNKQKLSFAVGQNCDGENYVADLAAMPHLLIAGATGAGKSVCLNSLIVSLIYKYTPSELKFLLVDPKQVELNMYNRIPHMLIPEAVSDKDKTLNLLDWAIEEMEMRYTLFKDKRVQKITDYNATIDPKKEEKLPYIVIIIDEVGDFMVVMKKELEERIVRLTQKARAAGIHLILATQRPSVDVITGIIKANLPARIAFAVASFTDSKTILDQGGAEKLLRYGDMIFSDGVQDPARLQGTLIEGEEVNAICDYIRENNECYFDPDIEEFILNTNNNTSANAPQASFGESSGEQDELFVRSLYFVVTTGAVSISKLQRKFGIGFPRAARIVDTMVELGYISDTKDNKQREIYIDMPTLLSKYGDVSLE